MTKKFKFQENNLNSLFVLFSKKYRIAFLAGHSDGKRIICPNNFHLRSVIVIDTVNWGDFGQFSDIFWKKICFPLANHGHFLN